MRKMKQLLCALCCALLVFSMSAPVRAAEYPDTYTVRIYAGRQGVMTECSGSGEIAGEGRIFVLRGLRYGSRISVSFRESTEDGSAGDVPADGYNRFIMSVREEGTGSRAEVTFDVESKYYIMGSRESGRDNSERVGSMLVQGDRDYVAAYGLMKDSVEYTINYVDGDGNTLRESEKYRGTIGDKPVVAYQYVEGYQPQAYNLTKTLSANAAENIFTFIYTAVTTPVNVVVIPGQPAEPLPPEPDQNVVDVVEGEEGPEEPGPEVPGPEVPGPGEEDLPDEPVPQVPGPEETIDLDDQNVPQNPFDDGGEGDASGSGIINMVMGNAFLVKMPMPVRVIVLCVLAALLGGGIWWLISCVRRKKDKDEAEEACGEKPDEKACGEKPEEKS